MKRNFGKISMIATATLSLCVLSNNLVEGAQAAYHQNDNPPRRLYAGESLPLPNPMSISVNGKIDGKSCNEGKFICDVNNVLTSEEIVALQERIDELMDGAMVPMSSCNINGKNSGNVEDIDSKRAVEVAVAIVRKMDKSNYFTESDGDEDMDSVIDEAAKDFAIKTHDTWEVGSAQCQSGILLFLSMEDRAIYISIGQGLENIFPWWRLESVMQAMKPLLRVGKISSAIENAFVDVRTYINVGPPSKSEKRDAYIKAYGLPVLIIAAFFGVVIYIESRKHKQEKEYALVRSRLSQIESDRARALQGQYQCSSCPICFEDFKCHDDNNNSWTIGCDDKPVKLLRCGHAFGETCWLNWVNHGEGDPTKCPVCRSNVGDSESVSLLHTNMENGEHENEREANFGMDLHRSDMVFRLRRLHQRHPRFIRNDQMERWTLRDYDGPLTRDPSFKRLDPGQEIRRTSASNQATKRSSFSSFGGGRSSGGRGGRW